MTEKPEHLEQLTAYLDGELPPGEHAEVERLLAGDADARRLLEELRRTSELVAALPRRGAPAHTAERVLARLERRALLDEAPPAAPHRTWHMRVVKVLALAASIALVVTAGWLVLPRLENAKRSTRVAELTVKDSRGDAAAKRGPSAKNVPAGRRSEELPLAAAPAAPGMIRKETSAGPVDEKAHDVRAAAGSEREPDHSLFFDVRSGPGEESLALGPAQPPEERKPGETPAGDGVRDDESARSAPARFSAGQPAISMKKEAEKKLDDQSDSDNLEDPEASRAMVEGKRGPVPRNLADLAAERVGEFDRLLQAGVMCNQDVRRTPVSDFSNHIQVETDDENRAEILAYVDSFMKTGGVQNAQERDLPEPIAPNQLFYSVQQAPGEESVTTQPGAGRRGEASGNGVEIVMNVTRGQAEELLSNIQQISVKNRAPVNWEANSVAVRGEDPVPEITGQLLSAPEFAMKGANEIAKTGTSTSTEPAKGKGTPGAHERETGERDETGLTSEESRRRAQTETKTMASRGARGGGTQAESAGASGDQKTRLDEAGKSAPASRDSETMSVPPAASVSGTATPATRRDSSLNRDDLVILALSLRVPQSPEMLRSPVRDAGNTRPSAPPASAPSPSTSQPTTQGSAGG